MSGDESTQRQHAAGDGKKGLELPIRLPWYRALPLSTVEIKQVSIDGQARGCGQGQHRGQRQETSSYASLAN